MLLLQYHGGLLVGAGVLGESQLAGILVTVHLCLGTVQGPGE